MTQKAKQYDIKRNLNFLFMKKKKKKRKENNEKTCNIL